MTGAGRALAPRRSANTPGCSHAPETPPDPALSRINPWCTVGGPSQHPGTNASPPSVGHHWWILNALPGTFRSASSGCSAQNKELGQRCPSARGHPGSATSRGQGGPSSGGEPAITASLPLIQPLLRSPARTLEKQGGDWLHKAPPATMPSFFPAPRRAGSVGPRPGTGQRRCGRPREPWAADGAAGALGAGGCPGGATRENRALRH